jgi:peptidylamidoglycolate lyase
VVELHCQYDATEVDRPTLLGLDERSREMCNQYYISTAALRFACDAERAVASPAATASVAAAAAAYGRSVTGTPVGQVTAVAADAQSIFFFHRGPTDFTNTKLLQFDPIVRYDRRLRAFGGAFGRGLFIVPHGLSVDHEGMLWATDVALHKVFKLDPRSGGRVLLVLGDGRAADGKGSFNKPTDVAVDRRTGDVYVADGCGASQPSMHPFPIHPSSFPAPHCLAIQLQQANHRRCRSQVGRSIRGRWVRHNSPAPAIRSP